MPTRHRRLAVRETGGAHLVWQGAAQGASHHCGALLLGCPQGSLVMNHRAQDGLVKVQLRASVHVHACVHVCARTQQ